jgi:putative ABC transport system substrate-binding protein
MRRREFITLIGGASSWPLATRAQQPAQMRRVGVLLPFDENDPEVINRVKQFRLGMRDLDWIEGRSVLIDFRFTGGNSESISRCVTELIKTAPDVIVSYATPGLAATVKTAA